MNDPALRFEDQICYALYKASRLMIQSYYEPLHEIGLTYLQHMMLMLISEHKSLSMKDASEKMALDSGTLSPLLQKLEKQGLVERSVDPNDQRSVLLRLTTKGKALQKRSCSLSGKLLKSLDFDLERARNFRKDLEDLVTQLQKPKPSPKPKGK